MMDQRKEMFERKKRYAENRMAENAENENLTPEQHDVLSWMAMIRHNVHTDQQPFFLAESGNHGIYWDYIDHEINDRLRSVGLSAIQWDISDMDYVTDHTWEDDDFDTYESAYESVIENVAIPFNRKIEEYLRNIDKENGTDYSPGGHTRLL